MLGHLKSDSSGAAPEEVRRQLNKLLASQWFARSGRMCAVYTASQLGRRELDLVALREEVKAGALLRGSWRRTGVRVRVTAQLIDSKSGAYLWSEAFEHNVEDLVAIQEEIARAIVDTVRLKMMAAQAAVPGDGHNTTFVFSRMTLGDCRSVGKVHATSAP